jgi:ATP synthase subunit 6
MFLHSPLEQFVVNPIFNLEFGLMPTTPKILDLTITNSCIFMILTVIFIVLLPLKLTVASADTTVVPSRWQIIIEIVYLQIQDMVKTNIHTTKHWGSLIFTIFIFVLALNLSGLVPYAFSVTAQIVITFGLSISIFIGIVCLGFINHGLLFLSLFFPPGAPILLAPLLVLIEIVSFSVRALSLGIRLAANMLAGHLLLSILSSFGYTLLTSGKSVGLILGLLPIIIVYILFALETATCLIQAYVFSLLTCIYLYEAIELH